MRKTFYAKTIRELDAAVAEYERKAKHGMLSSNEKMTFGELAKIWIDSYKNNVGEKTHKRYAAILRLHLLPEMEGIKLKDLKPHNLQAIINDLLDDGYAEKTMKDVKITASNVLEVAVDNDILYRNVFNKVSIPHVDKTERRALRQGEVDLIARTYQGHRMGIPALIMLYCGLRRGELVALSWRDIDIAAAQLTVNKAVYFDNNAAFLKPPKSKTSNRTVPIPHALLAILKAQKNSALLVCPSAKGHMMTETAFRSAWRSFQNYLNLQAGGRNASRSNPKLQVIDNITPHMLRHTYATMLYDAGVDVKSAQKFLGHADIQTTLKIYTHLSDEKEQRSIDAFNAHLGAL